MIFMISEFNPISFPQISKIIPETKTLSHPSYGTVIDFPIPRSLRG